MLRMDVIPKLFRRSWVDITETPEQPESRDLALKELDTMIAFRVFNGILRSQDQPPRGCTLQPSPNGDYLAWLRRSSSARRMASAISRIDFRR
jgi:hypothetical protein